MTHTQPKGNPTITKSESETSCLVVYISDKQDSKALLLLLSYCCHYYCCGPELEMKGFTQIEGLSTQGSDK